MSVAEGSSERVDARQVDDRVDGKNAGHDAGRRPPSPRPRWGGDAFTAAAVLVSLMGLLGLIVPRSLRLPAAVIPVGCLLAMALWGRVGRLDRPRTSRGGGSRMGDAFVGDASLVAGLAALLIGIGRRGVDWPFWGPVGRSVDAAHHGAMVTWIVDHGRLPDRVYPELRQFSEYFLFTHRVIADWARLLHVAPMRAMGFAGVVLLLLLLAATGMLAQTSALVRSQGRSGVVVAALGTVLVAVAAREYTLDMVVRSFFLAQLCALWLCSAACLSLTRPDLRRFAPLLGAASMACYPLQAPVFPGVMVVAFLVTRQRWLLRTLAQAVVVGMLGLAVQAPYLSGAFDMAKQEGAVTHVSVRSIGGPLVLALVGLGLVTAAPVVWSAWRTRRSTVPDPASASTPIPAELVMVAGFALTTAEHVAFVVGGNLGLVSKYSAAKIVFQIVPFGLALAAIGAVTLLNASATWRLRVPGVRGSVVTAVLAAGLLVATATLARSSVDDVLAPMDRSGYDLARSLPAGVAPTDVGVVGSYLSPYFVWWTGLRRPITDDTYRLLTTHNPWRTWPQGDRRERFVLAIGQQYVDAFSARPGVAVVRRVGDAALLRRSGS